MLVATGDRVTGPHPRWSAGLDSALTDPALFLLESGAGARRSLRGRAIGAWPASASFESFKRKRTASEKR